MKFAIIKTGGKQYVTHVGQTLKVEKLIGELNSKISFETLAKFSDENLELGKPNLADKVNAEIIENGRHDKIVVLRYMPKSRWAKKNGHKQPYTEVKILSI